MSVIPYAPVEEPGAADLYPAAQAHKSVEHLLGRCPGSQSLPDTRLVIVGRDHRPALEALAGNWDRWGGHFTGQVSHEEKVHWLNRAWVAVNPSPKEGWGLTVIEANACGVPVVAADSPGLRDSVQDHETGLLYPYGEIETLAAGLITLLRDRELRERMGEAARRWAGTFSWDESARKALAILRAWGSAASPADRPRWVKIEIIGTHFTQVVNLTEWSHAKIQAL